MVTPTLENIKQLAETGLYHIIPVSTEIFADNVTPIEVLKKLKAVSRHCFILESAEDNKMWGRYTFLGFDPKMEITCIDGTMKIVSANGEETIQTNAPNQYIEAVIAGHKSPKFDNLPPFTGGLVGYFAYDYAKYSEPSLCLSAPDTEHFQDVDLMLFDKVIAFDNYRQKIVLIVNISTENFTAEYESGKAKLEQLKNLVKFGKPEQTAPPRLKSEFKALFSQDEFCEMVLKAKEYIKEGDIFQVVLSNRFEAEFDGSLLDTYRVLRTINPSPYMFYFSGNDLEIAGASPETLVKLHNGKLFTFPLAGTRPRGETEPEDDALSQDLLADEKELAEHNMLVDLGRNDLGKISKIGSVAVLKYMSVLKFSHVMHIGSTVSGDIREDKSGLDAINALLPAGTLSGAPKIRAMQIINELEQSKRGIYGGAIGYIDFTGNMDTCIAIRITYKKNGKVFIRSGAGIVADSNAEAEYQECLNKSKAVRNALIQSAGGID
ncbi:MAG: anthranilate synthase component I [Lachnospiraceae bacterium]|nr:anthranilate synthase component I [Lachnospiraceae bacterium]